VSQRSRRPNSRPKQRRKGRRDAPRRDAEPDLLYDVAMALAADHPIELLAQVSSLLTALDPRIRSPLQREPGPEVPTLTALLPTFLHVVQVETSALLAAIAGLSTDEVLRLRVRRELADRDHVLPRWLQELADSTPAERVVEVVHALGDGDNILVGTRLPGGEEITAVIYIDHNAGRVVKDGFVVPLPLDELVEQMLTVADDPDTEARDISPADARVRITEAIEHGALTYPPYESDSWPASRPLIEWMTAMLPAGGVGYPHLDWDEGSRTELAERFLASPEGAGCDPHLLDDLLWFGTDYGPGDPLNWSPTRVEILLLDWIPRKIVAPAELLATGPDLLRAFIRFSHRERGIRAALTAETVAAVDEFEPEYQQLVRSPRPQGPMALLAAMGLPVGDPDDELIELREVVLGGLARVVGGDEALSALDDAALPVEEFVWDGIAADVQDRVGEVLGLVDDCCDALLDAEFRTAGRRLLARVATGDPDLFRRRGRADTAAAAICWVIGNANELFNPRSVPHLLAKTLIAHFGLAPATVTQRSKAILRAAGAPPTEQTGAVELGSPGYLVAARRARIIADRDHFRAMTT
jgi:Domain of unknown function (DUF6398)